MATILHKLYSNLNRQYGMHNELLEVLTRENAFALSFNQRGLIELEDIQTKKYALLDALGELEKNRQSVVRNFAISKGFSGEPTLGNIAEHVSEKEKHALLDLRDRLKNVTKHILTVSEKTAGKAKSRMPAFKNLYDMLTGTGIKPSHLYARTGKIKKKSSHRIFYQTI